MAFDGTADHQPGRCQLRHREPLLVRPSSQNWMFISPTMTAALIIPVIYSNTGNWSWLSHAFGTVMLLFVAFRLNQFASRLASSARCIDIFAKAWATASAASADGR
jgi:hypothetical protein